MRGPPSTTGGSLGRGGDRALAACRGSSFPAAGGQGQASRWHGVRVSTPSPPWPPVVPFLQKWNADKSRPVIPIGSLWRPEATRGLGSLWNYTAAAYKKGSRKEVVKRLRNRG